MTTDKILFTKAVDYASPSIEVTTVHPEKGFCGSFGTETFDEFNDYDF